MKPRTLLWIAGILLTLACGPTEAQDQIPESSGFGGFFMAGGAYFSFASNVLVGGEINYTFSSTRTQLFLGNRLEASSAWTWSSASAYVRRSARRASWLRAP